MRLSLVCVLLACLDAHGLVAQEPVRPEPLSDAITFDYQDADLRFVIGALAAAAGLNVVYASLPERPVTLRTNRPFTRAEILPLLRSIVESSGLLLVEEGAVLRIVAVPERPGPGAAVAQSDLRIFVYRLRHARADRIAGTLQALLGGGGGGFAGAGGLSRTGLSQELRTQQIPPTVPSQDPAADRPASQAAAQPAAPRVLPGMLQGALQIVPDELTNSLLVRVGESDWEVVRQAIDMLDLRPLQVLIEVMIAEVRHSSTFGLGVSIETPDTREPRSGAIIRGELQGQSNGDLVLSIMDAGGISADVVLSALSARGNVNIVSRPIVLAQNNQEARLMVGSQRPFIQVFRALPTDAAVRDQVVQYRDVGTSLTIRPTINNDGYVSLELVQEVSTATNETQFGAPIISTREAATQLLVKDNQTVVIGGLIDRQQDRTRSGIPILKDIPILGALFGSTNRTSVQTELFLFLTPHIISTDEDADRLRNDIENAAELLNRELPPERSVIPPKVPGGDRPPPEAQ